jgi:basic membrane protein A
MVGTTAAAWNDPAKGGELARAQFDRGADVVFAVAGGSGLGALQMAKEKGKLAIGVDSNQNAPPAGRGADLDGQARRQRHLRRLHAGRTASWKPGVTYKGLKEGGVDWVWTRTTAPSSPRTWKNA